MSSQLGLVEYGGVRSGRVFKECLLDSFEESSIFLVSSSRP